MSTVQNDIIYKYYAVTQSSQLMYPLPQIPNFVCVTRTFETYY